MWIEENVNIWSEFRETKKGDIKEYQKGVIKSVDQDKKTVKIFNKDKGDIQDKNFNEILRRGKIYKLVRDLSEIPILNDAELLEHFRHLYTNDMINSYCGPSLIVVNPYKKIESEISEKTRNQVIKSLKDNILDEERPHVWTIAAKSLNQLGETGNNQAICINGESGAGKTVSTKMCLDFLTGLQQDQSKLSELIMACNPILEAFGNAKTNRNDNSSRFGKYIKLCYQDNKIIGATTENYLLEKSRLIHAGKSERSFHVFYSLFEGMTSQKSTQYLINGVSPQNFNFLKNSNFKDSGTNDDKEIYQEMMEAFGKLGFGEDKIDTILRVLVAILYLGNIKVDEGEYLEGQIPCKIIQDEIFGKVVSLLGCDEDLLNQSLTQKVITLPDQVIKTPYAPKVVRQFITSLAKELYNQMFNWLVRQMNDILKLSSQSNYQTIGILDIFGFEIFEKNYLEQLFINYANEKLQGLYVDRIFRREQSFFESQNLQKYIHLIEYEDNLELIKSLDSPLNPIGIFTNTNEISQKNKTDKDLIESLKRQYKKSQYIKFHNFKKNIFYVKHTAKEVEYLIDHFVIKNKDEISQGLRDLMGSCQFGIAEIFPKVQKQDKQKFLAYKFTKNMNSLVEELDSSDCWFIRCIKPNEKKRSNYWVGELVLKQITYMGLINSLEIKKKNYIHRFDFKRFIKKYQFADESFNYQKEDVERSLVERLVSKLEPLGTDQDILIGKNMVIMQEDYKQKVDRALRKKLKIKIKNLSLIVKLWRDYKRKIKVQEYFMREGRIILFTKNILSNLNARIIHFKFANTLKIIQKLQRKFKLKKQIKIHQKKVEKMKEILKFLKLQKISQKIKNIHKIAQLRVFMRDRLVFLRYKARKRLCQKIIQSIIDSSWKNIQKKRHSVSSVVLQRTFRFYWLRKKLKKFQKQIQQRLKEKIKLDYVIYGQACARRFLVMSRLKRLNRAATKIQRYFKTKMIRKYFLKMVNSCVLIQRYYKYYKSRQLQKKQKLEEVVRKFGVDQEILQHEEYSNLFCDQEINFQSLNQRNFFKQLNTQSLKQLSYLPPPLISPKATLINVIFDFSTLIDTRDIYETLWSLKISKILKKERYQRWRGLQLTKNGSFLISEKCQIFRWNHQKFEQFSSQPKSRQLIVKDDKIVKSLNGKIYIENQQFQGNFMASRKDQLIYVSGQKIYPRKITMRFKIRQVCLGEGFMVVLDEQGMLFGCGRNDYGQLGVGDVQGRKLMTQIKTNKMVDVVCGYAHCLSLGTSNDVYGWGDNRLCQINKKGVYFLKPVKILKEKSSQKIKAKFISCGSFSSYWLDESSKLYMQGKTGLGILNQFQYPYHKRCFGIHHSKFKAVKIVTTWTQGMSLAYLTVLDFRNSQRISQVKMNKISNQLSQKWRQKTLYIDQDANLKRYINLQEFFNSKKKIEKLSKTIPFKNTIYDKYAKIPVNEIKETLQVNPTDQKINLRVIQRQSGQKFKKNDLLKFLEKKSKKSQKKQKSKYEPSFKSSVKELTIQELLLKDPKSWDKQQKIKVMDYLVNLN